jgi:hypothetical protein
MQTVPMAAADNSGYRLKQFPALDLDAAIGLTPVSSFTQQLGGFDIVINPTPGLAANPAALAAFERAAQLWEARIADPITVTIDAGLAALAPGVLGQAGSVMLAGGYDGIRNLMVADATNELDDGIAASLPTAAQAGFILPTGFGLTGNLSATKANLKALGVANLDTQFGVTDATITFSSNFAFDFDNSNGVGAGLFDFETVAAHEIGHALGFVSEVDSVDFLLNNSQTGNIDPTTLDLFRFQNNTANDPNSAATFTTAARFMVPGALDSTVFDQVLAGFGGDLEVAMSTGAFTGDGEQASHWRDNSTSPLGPLLGIMDPTLSPGVAIAIGDNDLRALDLIGYEIVVPEPAALAMLGLSLVALTRRRSA